MTAPTRPTGAPQGLTTPVTAGIGASPLRPDGTPKVKGEFAYGSDLWTGRHDLGRRRCAARTPTPGSAP